MLNCKVMKPKLKLADIFIILIAASFVFFASYSVYMKPRENVQVLIRSQSGEWTFPADAEETIVVTGVLGDTIVRLHENRAWIESSPCDNQTCVASGFVSKQGQWAACLPNNVLLMIQGVTYNEVPHVKEHELDSIAW